MGKIFTTLFHIDTETHRMPLQEFTEFYKEYLHLNTKDFENFIQTVETPLLSAFRITPTGSSETIREKISKYSFLTKVDYLDDVYTFDLKNKNEEYKEFIQFIVAQTDIGNIQRQEIVSFLPHRFLRLEKTHRVLETCASPGSKTKNLLEILTDGILISNDKSGSRVNVLISESMKKATPSFIITQMDAVQFPTLNFKFDRICCDVPCSSDGTSRKNPAIMPKWNVGDSISLSSIQLKILKRSLELLKQDGILVYSTCSLNPIEDEWVIHNAIGESKDFEIVDDYDFVQFENIDPSKITVRRGITEFDYKNFQFKNENLSKCFRILPHDQNTGGFFITAIRRIAPVVQKILPESNQMNSKFVELDEATLSKIKQQYKIGDSDHFISFNSNFKNVFAVSNLSYEILCKNPKLKAVYAGIKAFTVSDLRKDAFRAKSAYLEYTNIPTDITIDLDDFKKLLMNKTVSIDELNTKPEGLFCCTVDGISNKFSGFSGGNKVFLYIDDNHRKAYSQIYL